MKYKGATVISQPRNVMKLISYKCVVAKRRRIICAVLWLLFLGLFMKCMSLNFLHAAVPSLTNYDNIKDAYSRNLHLKFETILKRKKLTDSAANHIQESTESIETYLDTTTIARLRNSAVPVTDGDSISAEITSSILATMGENYVGLNTEPNETCGTPTIIGNSCKVGRCLQLQLPSDLQTRVKQIVTPWNLQLNRQMKTLLSGMADKVPGYYDLIIVSAVSSSHFEEGQAMLYNIHTHLFPYLGNFTFIYYNLGLSEEQRDFLAKICRCHLLDFPYELLPEFVSFRKCYAWKPLIVSAHITRSNLIVWMDASIRFNSAFNKFTELLSRARHRGMQVFLNKQTLAHITLPSMFHFFGDEACVYANASVIIGSVLVFHNDWFVRRAVVEPWAACAISRRCMCPAGVDLVQIRISCHHESGLYGTCHRFDQSAISIILVKVYQNRLGNIVASMKDYLDMKRGDKIHYPFQNVSDVA